MDQAQLDKVINGRGFIAALDQSGGSTPRALGLYGVEEGEYDTEDQMFDLIHEMRTRIMTDSAFEGDRVIGAILFEQTMDRTVDGVSTPTYLWERKQIVPFLKVDKGLADEVDGAQMMKPIDGLDDLLARARDKGVFGTKMRSVIKQGDAAGVKAVTAQQFEIGRQILAAGLMPIIEPEIDIHSPTKVAAEALLKNEILEELGKFENGEKVMLKLTLPETDGFLQELVDHPNVARVVALSGGYTREESNDRLRRNPGLIASFSRALTEGLTAQQSDEEFHAMLDESIGSIADASNV